MIEIKNLTKTYKLNKKEMKESRTTNPIKTAVNALTLTAKKGEIYGLLGPNGAGKTTTLRCISTIIKPTKGEIYVDGHEVRKEPEKVREKIGFLTGDIKLDPQFSPDYMFDFFGKIHGVKPERLKERKEELFTYFGIKDFAHKKMKELSTGMGQKAAIAVSLVHDPDIVIFDEPTNHLDLEAITALNNSLIDFNGTVLFTSQDHQFIQTVADRIIEISPNGWIESHYKYEEYMMNPEMKKKRDLLYKDMVKK